MIKATLLLHKALDKSVSPELDRSIATVLLMSHHLESILRSVKHLAQLIRSGFLVTEHRESHLQNFFDEADVTQNVIHVLEHGIRQLLVPSLSVIQKLDLPLVAGIEIVLAFTCALRLQALPPLLCQLHLLSLTVPIGQLGEVVSVGKPDRNLFLLLFVRVTTVSGFLLALRTGFYALSAIHEATERVLFKLNIPSHQTFTFLNLNVGQETVHDLTKYLRIYAILRRLRIDSLL